MVKSTLSKAIWLGRGASMVFGLALVLALVMGVATTALAAIPGDPFRLGQTNGIDTMSTLVGSVAGTMLRVDNNSTEAGATALDLRVEPGKPPMKVNSATRVALLNADKVDGKEATAFYAAGSKVDDSFHADQADSATSAGDANTLDGKDSAAFLAADGKAADSDTLDGQDSAAFLGANQKAADAELLDGKNSTDFADANHNHDSSYIQQSPTSAENASINITGTLQTRGMLRTGSGTGTFEGPGEGLASYEGLVVRRAVSNSMLAGNVVARTQYVRLERDGTMGGLRASWDTGAGSSIACMGLTQNGALVGNYSALSGPAGTFQVFTDSQNVVYYSCSFGWPGSINHVTEVTMTRTQGLKSWVGTLTSSINQ